MVGNAAEEGLLTQIGNPSHVDWGRIVVPASLISGFGAGYLLWRLVPFATLWSAVILGALVTLLVAWRLAMWFERRAWTRWCAAQEAERQRQIEATERALVEMHRKEREDA